MYSPDLCLKTFHSSSFYTDPNCRILCVTSAEAWMANTLLPQCIRTHVKTYDGSYSYYHYYRVLLSRGFTVDPFSLDVCSYYWNIRIYYTGAVQ
jgi:hypothetical protein